MSWSEILVILLVAIIVVKPEHIPLLLRKLQALKNQYTKMKNEILSQIVTPEMQHTQTQVNDDMQAINFYLQKIIALQGNYNGEYSLTQVKAKYHELVKQQLDNYLSNDTDKLIT